MMRDADLDQAAAARSDLDEQLRREEGATRFQSDAAEGISPEELAGAVHVADR
jgi:hypothetical protein